MRGGRNTDEILKPKYESFECDNIDEIRNHINTHYNIYLHGRYGIGKTHFVYWVANKYNKQGHHIFIKLAADIHHDLIGEIKYNQSTGEHRTSLILKMQNCGILFIDDLGNEKMTEYVHECLSSVLDYRYRNERPTFITSNYTLKELYQVWQPKIGDVKTGQLVSRIKTFGAIEMKGRNWRK